MTDQLTDDCILIRRFQYQDIDPLYDAVRDSIEEVSPWLPWCHPAYAKRETIEWITFQMDAWENGKEYSFGVFDKATEKLIGGCGLNQLDMKNKLANLGYWVRTGYTGMGVASRAARLTASFGFDQLKLNRLEILMAIENTASKKVAEKTGAHFEGVLRNRIVLNNVSYNAYLYSLIRSDLVNI